MSVKTGSRSAIRERLGLRPIINVSGTMTALGASIAVPEAVRAAAPGYPTARLGAGWPVSGTHPEGWV